MDKMDSYNGWIFNKFARHIKGKVLEVGCGIGSITQYYAHSCDVTAIDISEEYIDIVRQRFANIKNFNAHVQDVAKDVSGLGVGSFDAIICSNVLEHIEDDIAVLNNMNKLLRKDGILMILVPAMPVIYGTLDEYLGHHRRYSNKEIRTKLESAGFKIEEQMNINIFGAMGWFVSGRILKQKILNQGLLSTFNFLTPIFIFLENLIKFPMGLSVINICRKTK